MARVPMMLHVVEIGRERKGRRASPWARAWTHPTAPKGLLPYRFRNKDGSKPNHWNPVYLADDLNLDIDEWVEELWTEGQAQDLMRHVDVRVPSDSICSDTFSQIVAEAAAMRELLADHDRTTFRRLPMSRGSCDGIVPCPWQDACYSESTLIQLDSLGIYTRRRKMGAGRAKASVA
jgi:hypothetical protein